MRGVACVHTAGALPSRHHIVSGMISARDDVMVGLDRASSPVEWRISEGLVPYETALALMETRAAAIADGVASGVILLLQHPPLYTARTSAQAHEVIAARFPLPS